MKWNEETAYEAVGRENRKSRKESERENDEDVVRLRKDQQKGPKIDKIVMIFSDFDFFRTSSSRNGRENVSSRLSKELRLSDVEFGRTKIA